MAVLSMRARKKFWDVALAVFLVMLSWVLQNTVLSYLSFQGAFCNVLLTMTVLWGFVFGSSAQILPDELRTKTAKDIFLIQLSSGSTSGFLFGAFVAALYSSVLPVYPVCYPVIGWITGYFAMRHLNPETLMCIPLVLLSTVASEFITAFQLFVTGHLDVFPQLARIALPEALLNALITPFVYFPMWHWHEFSRSDQGTA